jgi:hypothetical protein
VKLRVSKGIERRKARHDGESAKGKRDSPAVRKELGRVRRFGQERGLGLARTVPTSASIFGTERAAAKTIPRIT